MWLFAETPAEPKLGPVYQPITHYVPLQFPPLILAPAFAIDVLRGFTTRWPRWARALVYGPAFVAVLVAVEWPFVEFLMSDAARTWVFGTAYHPYFMRPEWPEPQYRFWDDGVTMTSGLPWAAVAAAIASYLGMVLGDAVARVRR